MVLTLRHSFLVLICMGVGFFSLTVAARCYKLRKHGVLFIAICSFTAKKQTNKEKSLNCSQLHNVSSQSQGLASDGTALLKLMLFYSQYSCMSDTAN